VTQANVTYTQMNTYNSMSLLSQLIY